jgi:hypothetical protein
MGNLLLSTPAYLLPNQPAMTPTPFLPGDVSAVVGDEGPGVMVLSRNLAVGTGANQGRCLTAVGQGALTNDFAAPRAKRTASTAELRLHRCLLEAKCPHRRSVPDRANNAPGVLVNGYAHSLEISNNKIFTNSGTFAGGISWVTRERQRLLGRRRAERPRRDPPQPGHPERLNETGGGGGVVLGTGSTSYSVTNNFIAANLSAGNGGGISHVGLSQLGGSTNTVVFNESFMQGVGTNGGGLFVGGSPAAAGATTPGSGTWTSPTT